MICAPCATDQEIAATELGICVVTLVEPVQKSAPLAEISDAPGATPLCVGWLDLMHEPTPVVCEVPPATSRRASSGMNGFRLHTVPPSTIETLAPAPVTPPGRAH